MLVILFFERMCRFIALLKRTFTTAPRAAPVSGFRLSMQLRGNDFMETFNTNVMQLNLMHLRRVTSLVQAKTYCLHVLVGNQVITCL